MSYSPCDFIRRLATVDLTTPSLAVKHVRHVSSTYTVDGIAATLNGIEIARGAILIASGTTRAVER